MTRTILTILIGMLAGVSVHGQAVVFRSGIDLVNFGVTVTDRDGELVTDLTREDFEIYEDDELQAITYFSRGFERRDEEFPLQIGLLFDTSGSMAKDLELSRSAAIKFLNALPTAQTMTLVDFDTEVRVARYGQADFPRLVERIRLRKPEGWTALYDALGVYLDGAADQTGRKVMVLYTDGGDTRSSVTFADAVDMLRISDVTVYAIGFLEHQMRSDSIAYRQRLSRMSHLTGGVAFFPGSADGLDDVYDQIRAEIAERYALGYIASNTTMDGSWRKVTVKLVDRRHRRLKIRARQGYFAPYRAPAP